MEFIIRKCIYIDNYNMYGNGGIMYVHGYQVHICHTLTCSAHDSNVLHSNIIQIHVNNKTLLHINNIKPTYDSL